MRKELSNAFYDVMFGSTQTITEMNLVEEKALQNVRDILNNPQKLSSQIPPLPVVLLQLIDVLKDPNTEFSDIAEVLEKDPSLAVEVLRVANSSLYFRGGSEITSLQKAVSLLGVAGVANISTTILLEKIRPAKPIYYKMFGRQIWIHSVQCAFLCKALAIAEEQDEFDAYFLGLIHDVGKIIIFNCLCEALSGEFIADKPGSVAYKTLMAEMSADISFFIAQEWALPQIYQQALQTQHVTSRSALSKLLYKADLLSEVYLLLEKKLINDQLVELLLEKLSVDKEIWEQFVEVAPKVANSIH